MNASLQLTPPPTVYALSILAPEFQSKLSSFNDVMRSLRTAEVVIESMSFLDNEIGVASDCVELISRRFAHEVRGQRQRPAGKQTRHAVTIRGVDVVWFTPVKEQNQ
jgi:hypothetical protein